MTDQKIKELKEKKITCDQAFIFQEILIKIKIELVGQDIMNLIEEIRKDSINLTDDEKLQLESIDKIENEDERKKKFKKIKTARTIKVGIKVNKEIKSYILKHLYKVKKEIKDLVIDFSGDPIDSMDDLFDVFFIMWDIGLFKLVMIHLQNKDIYVKKK